jgi:UDP-galactopyranose mutase
VSIADSADEFIKAAEQILTNPQERNKWLARVDDFLADVSWDKTWKQMSDLIDQALEKNRSARAGLVRVTNTARRPALVAQV